MQLQPQDALPKIMYARFYSNQTARFLSVDPVVKRVKNSRHPQRWNQYSYVLNRPIALIDPNGEDSFLAGRPLANAAAGRVAQHLFVVTNARFVGDPNATVHSFGQTDRGTMGRVDGATTNAASMNTNAADTEAWRSQAGDNPQAGVVTTQVNAPDSIVAAHAESVVEDQDYSALAGPFGVNSNSAAVAVVEEASGEEVDTPGLLLSPGEGNADKVEFDLNNDGVSEPRKFDSKRH